MQNICGLPGTRAWRDFKVKFSRLFLITIIGGGAYLTSFCKAEADYSAAIETRPAAVVPAQVWLSEAATNLTPEQSNLLARARSVLLGNIVRSPAWNSDRGIMPSIG